MIIYLDENLPFHLADGLNSLNAPLNLRNQANIEVKSISQEFKRGVKDEDWIPIAGRQNAVAITMDIKIHKSRHQRKLCEEYGLGLIFFRLPKGGLSYWEMVRGIVNKWEQIVEICTREKTPFAYRFSPKKPKLDKLN